MAKKVTVIRGTAGTEKVLERPKMRVCGYARVSTGSSKQAESYATQVEYTPQRLKEIPCGSLPEFMRMKHSPVQR